jgi:predicted Zn-dependent protease
MSSSSTDLRGEDFLLGSAVNALREMPGGGAVFVTSRRGEYTRFAGQRIHQPQAIDEVQLMANAFGPGGQARVATSRLQAARWAGAEAAELARTMRTSSAVPPPLAPPAQVQGVTQTWHDSSRAFDAGTRGALAGLALAAAARVGAIANGMFSSVVTELAVANTAGLRRYVRATEVSLSILVRKGAGSGFRADLGRDARALGPELMIEEALRDALATENPQEVAAGTFDVVLGPLAVGDMLSFFHALGFSGDDLRNGSGAVARRRGEMVAAPEVCVRDDANDPTGLPIPFDFEGVDKARVAMLDRGRVADAVTDLATARALGVGSSGHAHIGREQAPGPIPANLIMEPGTASEADLIRGIERGVYISRFHYTRMIDPEKSSFTGVTRDASFRIQDGKLGEALKQSRFSEEVFGVLARVDGLGRNLVSQPLMNVWNGSASAPAIRVRGFHLGFR